MSQCRGRLVEFDGEDESTDLENMMELAWNDRGVFLLMMTPSAYRLTYRQDGRGSGHGDLENLMGNSGSTLLWEAIDAALFPRSEHRKSSVTSVPS